MSSLHLEVYPELSFNCKQCSLLGERITLACKFVWLDVEKISSIRSPSQIHCARISMVSGCIEVLFSSPLPSWSNHAANSPSSGSVRRLRVSLCCSNWGHKDERLRQVSMMTAGGTRGTTGRTCRKSPPSLIVFPPKGQSSCMMSRRHLSMACRAWVGIMKAPSMMMRSIPRRYMSCSDLDGTLQVLFSKTGTGSLKRPCTVRPSVMKVIAMPHAAHATVMP